MKRFCLVVACIGAALVVVGLVCVVIGVQAEILTPEAMLALYGTILLIVGFVLLVIFGLAHFVVGVVEEDKKRRVQQEINDAHRRYHLSRPRTRGAIHH